MKLVVDVNLPPKWVEFLATRGIEDHEVGARRGLRCAHQRPRLLGDAGPSILQVRTQDVFPESLGAQVVRVLTEQSDALESGAIVTIDEIAARVRILPIRRQPGSEEPV
jgi:predicted nuclease of predicted toxin-antitoxin system